jgi:hypothetical protein
MNTIEMRLQKLEAANRRYKKILLLMMAAFATVFMAFRSNRSVPDVIQAKKFEVVDDNDNVLVRLSQKDNNGAMRTYRSNGNILLNFSYSTKNAGYVGMEDGNGQELIRFGNTTAESGGGGNISLFNPSGKKTLAMYNSYSGGNIHINNSEGNIRADMLSVSEAGGAIALYNSSGNKALKFTQTTEGNGDIYVNKSDGDVRLRLSVSPSAGNLELFNDSKTKVVILGATDSENGTVRAFNSNGDFIQGIGTIYK